MIILQDSEAILLQYFIEIEWSNINISNIPNWETSDSATEYLWRKILTSPIEKINISPVKNIGLHQSACTADYLSRIYIFYVSRRVLSIYSLYSHHKLEDTVPLTSKVKNMLVIFG